MYIILSLISGILLGFSDIIKKKVLAGNSLLKVLLAYALVNFLLTSYGIKSALQNGSPDILLIFIKALIIYFCWIMFFKAMKELPISIATPFCILGPIFAVILGQVFLGEYLAFIQYLAIAFMILTYYFICKVGKIEVEDIFKNKYIYFLIMASFLGALSALIDRVILKNITTGQLQFWFNFFMAVLFGLTVLILSLKKSEIVQQKFIFSWFIPLMSLVLVISDRVYFYAIQMPEGSVSLIIPLRNISIIISTIIGGLIFKEKNIEKKFKYVCILVAGVGILFLN